MVLVEKLTMHIRVQMEYSVSLHVQVCCVSFFLAYTNSLSTLSLSPSSIASFVCLSLAYSRFTRISYVCKPIHLCDCIFIICMYTSAILKAGSIPSMSWHTLTQCESKEVWLKEKKSNTLFITQLKADLSQFILIPSIWHRFFSVYLICEWICACFIPVVVILQAEAREHLFDNVCVCCVFYFMASNQLMVHVVVRAMKWWNWHETPLSNHSKL